MVVALIVIVKQIKKLIKIIAVTHKI